MMSLHFMLQRLIQTVCMQQNSEYNFVRTFLPLLDKTFPNGSPPFLSPLTQSGMKPGQNCWYVREGGEGDVEVLFSRK